MRWEEGWKGDRRTELIEDCNGVLPVDHDDLKRAEEGTYKRDGRDRRESRRDDEKEGEGENW